MLEGFCKHSSLKKGTGIAKLEAVQQIHENKYEYSAMLVSLVHRSILKLRNNNKPYNLIVIPSAQKPNP